MKKILLFFSLAVFVFILAGSAQAAVTAVAIPLPADGELNYQTTKPITWNSDAVSGARFNISIVQTVGATEVVKPIATRVLCHAPAGGGDCTYSWKVGSLTSGRFSMGVDYKIRVCVNGVTPADCNDSAAAFKIIPPALTTQQQVLDLFNTALGNRYNDLNANYNSGVAGVRDFIMVNTAAAGATASYRIPVDTVNTDKVYAMTTTEQLDWFKDKFKTIPSSSFLNDRDKAGIKQAMSKRYSDICAAGWNTTINGLTKTYNTAVSNAERARKGVRAKAAVGTTPASPATGEELCKFDYNRDLKDTAIVPAKDSNYNNATLRFIAIQKLQDRKDLCITAEYKKLYDAKVAALSTLEGAIAVPTDAYGTCIGTRISNWW